MKRVILGIMASSLMVAGCATMSKAECQVADWYQVGAKDGSNGHDWSRLASHAKACAKVGITPDRDVWEQGRQAGLQSYCTTANAYRLGRSGSRLNSVCPSELLDVLTRANNYGYNMNRLESQIEKDRKELTKLREQLKKLQEGDNLEFKSEKEARAYMVGLPAKINALVDKIIEDERVLSEAQAYNPYN